jgi:hypothetical protein
VYLGFVFFERVLVPLLYSPYFLSETFSLSPLVDAGILPNHVNFYVLYLCV